MELNVWCCKSNFVKFVTTWWIPGGRLESSALSEFPWRKRTASLPPLRSALGSLLRSSPYVRADPFGSEMKVTGIICQVLIKSPFFIQNPKNIYVSWNRRRSFRSLKRRLNVGKFLSLLTLLCLRSKASKKFSPVSPDIRLPLRCSLPLTWAPREPSYASECRTVSTPRSTKSL